MIWIRKEVTADEVNAMPQLDRIEYRQIRQLIEKDYSGGNTITSFYFAMGLLFLLAMFSLLFKAAGYESWLNVYKNIGKLVWILAVYILMNFGLDVYNFLKGESLIKKLNKRFGLG